MRARMCSKLRVVTEYLLQIQQQKTHVNTNFIIIIFNVMEMLNL